MITGSRKSPSADDCFTVHAMNISICANHVRLSQLQATSYCSLLAVSFVSSLYILVPAEIRKLHRDNAIQIRWRAMAASFVCVGAVVSYPFLFCDEWRLEELSIALSVRSTLVATGSVLFHISMLYLGPIIRCLVVVYDFARRRDDGVLISRFCRVFYAFYIDPIVAAIFRSQDDSERWTLLRNSIIAPATEEIVFRFCMVPVLRSTGMSTWSVSFAAPLFFGFAHVHHALLKLRQGGGTLSIIFETLFQFAYTSAFGAYVSYVFLRTGSLGAVVACHTFCNAMGVPDLSFLHRDSPQYHRRTLLMTTLVLGLIGFVVGLVSLDLPKATISLGKTTAKAVQ